MSKYPSSRAAWFGENIQYLWGISGLSEYAGLTDRRDKVREGVRISRCKVLNMAQAGMFLLALKI